MKSEINSFKIAYFKGLAAFLETFEQVKDTYFNDPVNFSIVLKLSFTCFNLTIADLCSEERINKSSISKWINGIAFPTAPTRKIVINWIKQKLKEQLELG